MFPEEPDCDLRLCSLVGTFREVQDFWSRVTFMDQEVKRQKRAGLKQLQLLTDQWGQQRATNANVSKSIRHSSES